MHRESTTNQQTKKKRKKYISSSSLATSKKKKKTMMMCSDDNLNNQQCPQVIMMKKKDKKLVSTSSTAIAAPNNEVEQNQKQTGKGGLKCPRCNSSNTKFCYYNNYSLSQPRHFCKSCKRYWTLGGSLRNVPVGGSSRKKNKPLKPHHHLSSPPPPPPPPPLPLLPNPLLFTTDHMITNSLNNINYLISLPSFSYSSIDIEQHPNIGLVHSTSTADHLNYFSSFNHDDNLHQTLLPLDYHVPSCDNSINNINLTSDHALYLNSGSDLFL